MKLSSLKPKRCLIFLKKNLHTFRDDCCSIFKIKNPTYSRRAADNKRLTSVIYIYIYIYIYILKEQVQYILKEQVQFYFNCLILCVLFVLK